MPTHDFVKLSNGNVDLYGANNAYERTWMMPIAQIEMFEGDAGFIITDVTGRQNRFLASDSLKMNGNLLTGNIADKVQTLRNTVFFKVNTGTGGTGNVTTTSATAYREINSADATTDNDYTVNATSGTFTLSIISPAGRQGVAQEIVNSGTGTITLVPLSGTIMGQTSVLLLSGRSVTLKSTGTNYIITSAYSY